MLLHYYLKYLRVARNVSSHGSDILYNKMNHHSSYGLVDIAFSPPSNWLPWVRLGANRT